MLISTFITKYRSNKTARDASLYMLFNVLQKLVPFLLLPVLSRLLSVEAMGFYILYQTIFNFIIPIITLNADSSVLLGHYHLDNAQFKRYFSSGIIVFFIAFVCICIFTLLFRTQLSQLLKFDVRFLYLMYVGALFFFFNRINLNLWQVEKKPVQYGIFNVLLALTENALMLLAIYNFPEYSWKGLIFALISAQILFFLYSVFFLYKRGLIHAEIDRSYMVDIIKVGAPLTMHQLGAWSGNLASRLIVNTLIGTAAAGRFGVGVMFGTAMTLIQDSFNKAFTPSMFEKLKAIENETDQSRTAALHKNIVKTTYLYNTFLFIIAVIISLAGYFLVGPIFGKEYQSSRVFISWAVFAAAFNGMYKMHVLYMFYKKKTRSIATITIYTGLLNIVLCIVLIKSNNNSAVGAAQSLMITQFVAYLLSWYKSNKIYPMPWFKI